MKHHISEAKSKSGKAAVIWRAIAASGLCKGPLSDLDWSNQRKLVEAIEKTGIVLDLQKADYFDYPNGGKTWSYLFREGDKTLFNGIITASFCGSMEDPTSKYDLVVVFS